MNWVLILVIVILAGYTLAGYSKGFLKIVYSLVSWLVILGFVIWVTPQVHNYLKTETEIYEKVIVYCEETLREQARQGLEENSGDTEAALTDNELFTAIADRLPEGMLDDLMEQTSDAANEFIESYEIYNRTAVAMADLILQGISALLAIAAGAIVSGLLSMVLGFIAKLPLLGVANKILGLAAGAANGLLIVWIAFYLAAVLCATELGSTVISHIYANKFLTFLYENNLVLSILM